MAELMDQVRVLADQIGPRPVSTEEEHQTSLFVAQELTDEGLDVAVDEFATPTGTRWPYAIAFLLAILGTIISGVGVFVPGIATTMYVVGFIFLVAGYFIYYTEINNKPILSKMRAGGVSQNVVARYVPSSVQREQRRRKVIIVAHVDTVRAEPECMPALLQHTPLMRRIIYFVMIGLVALEAVRFLPLPWPSTVDLVLWVISLVGCVYILLATACIAARRFMPYLSGGNDNASSIAVLLAVAKRLLDPEERERYAVERPVEQTGEIPVETLVDQPEPIVHDAAAAYAAGVVPPGAQVEYGEAGQPAAPTTVIPLVDPATGLPVTPAAPQGAADATQVIDPGAFGQGQPGPAQGAQAPQGQQAGYQPLPDELFAQSPEQAVAPAAVSEPEMPAVAMTVPENGEVPAGGFWPHAGDGVEAVTVGEVVAAPQPEESAPPEVTQAPAPEPAREARPSGVPSWYKVAKARAAADMADKEDSAKEDKSAYRSRFAEIPVTGPARTAEEPEPAPEPAPVQEQAIPQPAAQAEPQAREAAAPAAEPRVPERPQPGPAVSAQAAQPDAQAAPAPESGEPFELEVDVQAEIDFEEPVREAASAGTAVVEPERRFERQPEQEAPEIVEQVVSRDVEQAPDGTEQETADAALELDFREDEFDELTPDLSGMFEPVQAEPRPQARISRASIPSPVEDVAAQKDEGQEPEREPAEEAPGAEEAEDGRKPGLLRGLTSRIPIIGASAGVEQAGETAAEGAEAPAPRAQGERPKSKPERRKPTARHLTQEFQPTRPASERENKVLDSMRQQAAVSSTYEATPQAGPERDPFAPRDERVDFQDAPTTQMPQVPQTPFPSLSGQMPAVGADSFGSPGNSSSFPALSGSFPAISGAIPTINPDDFGASDYGYEPGASDVDEGFSSPAMTSEIEIPESRFHNAMDKMSGIFGRKNKKRKKRRDRSADGTDAKEELGSNDVENWDEDDDFGWKGGGYFDEGQSALEAAKARAAEIRDSVIQMTENDLLDKEVWFVALGASSANAQGMKNFLELHGSELRGSLIINLEAVGAGEIRYVDYEGTGKSHRSDRRLQSLVKKASRDLDGVEMAPQKLEWRSTDATPAMLAGMRALSIMGFEGVAPAGWHWTTDTADIVDPDNLEYVTKLLLKMIENS